MFGYRAKIFIPNVISCGAVAVKLTKGFIGFHLTCITPKDQTFAVMKYDANKFLPSAGSVIATVFLVNETEFGAENIKTTKTAFKAAFNKDLTVIVKPGGVPLETDVWVHKPADPKGTGSWIGVWKHVNAPPTALTTNNPNVMRIKAKSTTI